jgi:uncharacterized protein DUF6603
MDDTGHHNWVVRILFAITDGLVWIASQLADPEVRKSVYADLGLPLPPEGNEMPDLSGRFDTVKGYIGTQEVKAEQIRAAIEELRGIYQALRDFLTQSDENGLAAGFDALLRLMVTNYIRLRAPWAYWTAQPLLLLDDTLSSGVLPSSVTGAGIGFWDNIKAFANHPISYIGSIGWPPLKTADDAQELSDIVVPPLATAAGVVATLLIKANWFRRSDIEILYGWETDPQSTTPIADALSERMFSVSFGSAQPDAPDEIPWSLGTTTALVAEDEGGPGLFVSINGSVSFVKPLGKWKLKGTISSASAFAVTVPFGGPHAFQPPGDAAVQGSLEHLPDPTALPQMIDIGAARLEFGDFKIVLGYSTSGLILRAVAEKSAFVIDPKSDAVVDRAVGSSTEALRIQVSAGLAYANGTFSIDGGSSFLLTIPVAISCGVLQVRGVTLGLIPGSDDTQPSLSFEMSATIVASLSCFALTVDRLGVTVDTTNTDLQFTSKGIGLAIKSDVVSGGGYLFFDHTNSTYAGVFDVSIHDCWSLKAVGLLTTRLDGQKVFSLLLIVSATNLHFTLPLDFILTGIGVLLGLDREVNMAALEAGVKAHSLDNLMFPTDPIANAPAIVNSAAAAFPPSLGQTLFGGMIQISWGAQNFARAELAVIHQWGHSRWVVLGKGRAFSPTEKNATLRVLVDFVGDYDGGAKRAFAYLSLNGTKFGNVTIDGEAALLSEWSATPSTFVLSIGGFNPRYQPFVPVDFPSLARVKVSVKSSPLMKIDVTGYFAYTSNSTQFGGSIAAILKAGKFGVEGSFSVDALFQDLEPTFVLDLQGKLELKAWDVTMFMVAVQGTYAGSHPHHLTAKATFELFIFSHTFSIDKCWGEPPAVTGAAQEAVDVSAQFAAALADPSSWNPGLPAPAQSLVTFRADVGRMLHPLGTIRLLQRVVPLGLAIERFGSAPVKGLTLFQIDSVTVAGSHVVTEALQDQFARSQFFNMTDDEKLSTPAFEQMDAGVTVPPAPLNAGPGVAGSTRYKTLIYNPVTKEAEPVPAPYSPTPLQVLAFAAVGAAAKAAGARNGSIRYKGPLNPIRVGQLTFAIASTASAMPSTGSAATTSFSIARQNLDAHLSRNPADRQTLQVLPVAG